MRLEYLGHACFLIHLSSGTTILVDPYAPGGLGGRLRYRPLDLAPDLVLVSHEHLDHSDLTWLSGAPVAIRGGYDGADVAIVAWQADHDELGGTLRGGRTRVFSIRAEGIHLVHCGDLGERLTPDRWAHWGQVDVLVIPVGGYYTLGPDGAAELVRGLRPRFVVPCHYRTEAADWPELQPVEAFLRRLSGRRQGARVERLPSLTVEVGSTGPDSTVVVLEPLGV